MRQKLFLAVIALTVGTFTPASAQLSNILSKIQSAISSVTGSSSSSLEGTWVYSGAEIEFTSDNILSQVGGKVASNKIEKSINNALTKYGIAPNKLSFTFSKDSTYTAAYSSRSTQGTYVYTDKKLTLKPSTYSGRTITANASVGSTLTLTCNADKMLSLIQAIGSKVSSTSQNSTLSIISSLAKNYKGMQIGLKFTKK